MLFYNCYMYTLHIITDEIVKSKYQFLNLNIHIYRRTQVHGYVWKVNYTQEIF